jgi:membrane protease YdiL (CAAX protease family)
VNAFDILLLLLLAVVAPLYDHYVDVPRFRRMLREQPELARRRWYRSTFLVTLTVTVAALVAWSMAGRPWAALRLTGVQGWRAWVSLALTVVLAALIGRDARRLREEGRRARLQQKLPAEIVDYIPRSAAERSWILPVSLMAGFGEELLYRGYFIAVLAPWLTWWGAAALSVVCFGIAHNYQGRAGIVRTGLVGAFLTLVVAITGSLLPAMVLHALIDIGNLFLLSVILRNPGQPAPAAPAPPEGTGTGQFKARTASL